MSASVIIRHTFEAGHRLMHLPGKCQSLHGHSWGVEVEVTGDESASGVIVEFGVLKRVVREWIDSRLDHGLMLGEDDPLTPLLLQHGKVYVFGYDEFTDGLPWPTVENVATLIARMVGEEMPHVRVLSVRVTETPVNAAVWRAESPDWKDAAWSALSEESARQTGAERG